MPELVVISSDWKRTERDRRSNLPPLHHSIESIASERVTHCLVAKEKEDRSKRGNQWNGRISFAQMADRIREREWERERKRERERERERACVRVKSVLCLDPQHCLHMWPSLTHTEEISDLTSPGWTIDIKGRPLFVYGLTRPDVTFGAVRTRERAEIFFFFLLSSTWGQI